MKKIATITFHSSYNYGSNLQAYALQEFIKKISNEEIQYDILNLRIDKQKEMYKNDFEKKTLKSIIKRILFIRYKKVFKQKTLNFEKFINSKLNITKEYSSAKELSNANLEYDYFISGSDQLWNINAIDFDWSYYLEFVDKGTKISYSASFGPKKIQWNHEIKERVKKNLLSYDMLSVREQGSYLNVKELTNKEPLIHVDPTLLLTNDEWNKIIDETPVYKGDYIFLYDLNGNKNIMDLAKKLSKELDLPIVISKYMGFSNHYLYNFKKIYKCGPLEFLNLIKNAKLVLSSSFHGNVFAVLFHKHFFAINGDKDLRINNLLTKFNLENRTINSENIHEKSKIAFEKIDFKNAEKILDGERKKSKEYLMKALNFKEESMK